MKFFFIFLFFWFLLKKSIFPSFAQQPTFEPECSPTPTYAVVYSSPTPRPTAVPLLPRTGVFENSVFFLSAGSFFLFAGFYFLKIKKA